MFSTQLLTHKNLLFALLGLTFAGASELALAQQNPQPQDSSTDERSQALQQSGQTLQQVLEERAVAEQRTKELQAEIDALKRDKNAVTAALVQAAKTEKLLTTDLIDMEGKVADLIVRETAIKSSLNERRAVLAEVLAGLQRMGLNPPPAMLVKPEDALSSVRSSILLAAVVPEMRAQTSILLDDLNELSAIRTSLTQERERLDATRLLQRDEQERLSLLLEEKRALEGRTTAQLEAEQARASQLAAQAQTLQGLIEDLQEQIERDRQEAEEARQAAERARLRAEAEARIKRQEAEQAILQEARERALAEAEAAQARAAALRRAEEAETARPRLEPRREFASATRALSRPVGGRMLTAFGADDGLGTIASGETVEARIGAIVTTPADATVLYAGPFRAYGQLLILDVGGGYHIVLAGMSQLDVLAGQNLVAGEPVGTMGNVKLAGISAAAIQNDNPTLYIEFRKNGKPVDPAPWWDQTTAGR